MNAVNLLKDKIPGLELRVYGIGEDLSLFLEMVRKLNLDNIVKVTLDRFQLKKLLETIPECDVGIIPNRLNPFTQDKFSNKNI
ncbi:MAG: hypothetical protein MZV64_69450 [Ignavibacteriales bacterium]|nr:hypothetical protein [Ignavibacteriales bacterium]